MSNKRANLFHLLLIRWATLVNLLILYLFNLDKQPPLIFAFAVLYNTTLTIYWRQTTDLIKRYPYLVFIDLTISTVLIGLTRGNWGSPYYLYSLTSILIAAFFLRIKSALAATTYFSVLYTIGLVSNREALARVIENNLVGSMIASYLALFLITIFFGYPAHVIRKIEETYEDTAKARENLGATKERIKSVVTPDALSCRELEILTSLSEGKTNQEIAKALHITEKTVKNHLYRIYKKLGISNREEAIYYFRSNTKPETT